MVDAADHVGDAHVVVIDDDGEIVGRVAVAANDDEVVEVLVGKRDAALHLVLDHGLALARRFQANDRGHAGRRLACVAVAPGAADRERTLLLLGRLAHGVELGG